MTDSELLRAFVREDDQEAFREIVERHARIIYGAAVRQSGAGLAEDVTQNVFIVQARKARSLNAATLTGWLLGTTRRAAMEAQRREIRHKRRETKAAAVKKQIEEAHPNEVGGNELSPLLDAALARLKAKERSAVALRYLEGRSMEDVATITGSSEVAAAKRVTRAIAKLRDDFARHGVVLSANVLGGLLMEAAKTNGPAGLAANAARVALSSAASPGLGVGVVKGAWMAMTGKAIWMGVAAVIAIAVVGTSIAISTSGAARPGSADATPPSAKGVKVGVIVSLTTATGPNFAGTVQGWKHAEFEWQLKDKAVEAYAVVDPGTEKDPEVVSIVKRFYQGRMVNGGDAAALRKLDVIVATGNANMHPDVLDAMIIAISQGTGFLCVASTVGGVSPADPERLDKLHGIENSRFYYHPPEQKCVVIADHPLVAALNRAGKKQFSLKRFDGCRVN